MGLDYTFSTSLSPDTTDLALTYAFFNGTGSVLGNILFFSYLDAEIDESVNTFFNEYGEAIGVTGSGSVDADPDTWEIDEPGFVFGDIFDHLLMGTLDDLNAVPIESPDDVAMALGFNLGTLNPLEAARVTVLLSEDGDSIGSLALVHHDSDPGSTTFITLSGQSAVATVPEPSSLLLLGVGLLAFTALKRIS